MKRFGSVTLAVAALALALVACGGDDGDKTATSASPRATQAVDAAQLRMKVGLLPIVDILPMLVADQEGYFKEEGLTVELPLFASALERDAAMAAGAIDGELADLIASSTLNKERAQGKIVRLAYEDQPNRAQIAVLVGKDSGLNKLSDLAGVPIAISSNSVIEYETAVLLQGAGLSADQIKTTEVPQIPVRAQLLGQGQLKAATLPEPSASFAELQGARVIVDDRGKDIAGSVVVFSTDALQKKSEGIRRFLRAYERAVTAINGNPSKYEALLFDKARVPDQLKGKFGVPQYPKASVPSETRVKRAVDWMVSRNMLPKALAYRDLVDNSYLPK